MATIVVHGDDIRRLRLDRGLSQAQLAVRAGVGLATVQRAERSTPQLGYGPMRKIALALEVPLTAIYDDALADTSIGEVRPEWLVELHAKLDAIMEMQRRIMPR